MVVYLITNLVNDKKYVGQTIEKYPSSRWNGHKTETRNGSKCSIHMAFRKYGIKNFQFEVIDESANNIDELNDLEEFYISFYDTFKGRGYNMTSGGDSRVMSEETKDKIRQTRLGTKASEETKKLFSEQRMGELNGMYGRTHSKETIELMKENRGSIHGKNNPMYGRKHSDETKEKIRQKALGRKRNKS